jgi:myo-inositol-hexaphosphate 3-phosphohydrolase
LLVDALSSELGAVTVYISHPSDGKWGHLMDMIERLNKQLTEKVQAITIQFNRNVDKKLLHSSLGHDRAPQQAAHREGASDNYTLQIATYIRSFYAPYMFTCSVDEEWNIHAPLRMDDV